MSVSCRPTTTSTTAIWIWSSCFTRPSEWSSDAIILQSAHDSNLYAITQLNIYNRLKFLLSGSTSQPLYSSSSLLLLARCVLEVWDEVGGGGPVGGLCYYLLPPESLGHIHRIDRFTPYSFSAFPAATPGHSLRQPQAWTNQIKFTSVRVVIRPHHLSVWARLQPVTNKETLEEARADRQFPKILRYGTERKLPHHLKMVKIVQHGNK